MKKPHVFVAVPTYGPMEPRAVSTLTNMFTRIGMDMREGLYDASCWILSRVQIANSRSILAEKAVEQKCSHILFIDDDMTVPPDLLSRLLAWNKPLVSALCFKRLPPYDPVCFNRLQKPGTYIFEPIKDFRKVAPKDGLLACDAVGFGTVLIQTEVFGKILKPWFWYGDGYGEDIFFCDKAKEAGYQPYMDLNTEVGHISQGQPIGEWHFDYHRKHSDNGDRKIHSVGPTHHLEEVSHEG